MIYFHCIALDTRGKFANVIMMSNVKLLAEHTDEIISLDYTVYC